MKVKRYNLTNPYDCGMEKHPTGEYVLFEDYKQMSDYADRLVEHKNMVCLPADLKNLREANAHFATENEMLKNAMTNDRDAAAAEGEEMKAELTSVTEQRDAAIETIQKINYANNAHDEDSVAIYCDEFRKSLNQSTQ